jgi:hypothetical protein
MIDTNGDGSITEQEFLSAARECLEVGCSLHAGEG